MGDGTFDEVSLRGVWAALALPWGDGGALDCGLIREVVGRYQAAGVNGVYTTGTDGELHVLELDGFRRLVDAFVPAVAAAGLPAQVGCTWVNAEGVHRRAEYARAQGIGCVQLALPFWEPLSVDEAVRFFADFGEAFPELALVHYNIAKTGRFLTGADYRAVLDVAPTLIGTKQTGGDVGSLIEVVQATPELRHFVVDGQIVPGALFGAKGFYSFLVNLNPRFTVELWRDCERGDWVEAARKRMLVESFFRDWLSDVGPVTASPALAKLAARVGIAPEMPLHVRSPYRAATEAQVTALRRLLREGYGELCYDA